MVLTRSQDAAQQSLFHSLIHGDVQAAETVLRSLRGPLRTSWALHAPEGGVLSSMHLAAALNCHQVMGELAAAGAAVDGQLAPAPVPWTLPWLQVMHFAVTTAHPNTLLPGCTPLTVACRLGHVESVRRLLELGADPNACGPPAQGYPKPFTPLSAVVLSTPPAEDDEDADGDASAAGLSVAATRAIARLLLQHGADPLAPSVRRRCSTLRCACGSEFLPNGSLSLCLDSLEQRHRQRRLAFGSGDAAAEVMVAAARCCRLQLFRLAHEYVLAASGRRPLNGGASRRYRGGGGSGHGGGGIDSESDGSDSEGDVAAAGAAAGGSGSGTGNGGNGNGGNGAGGENGDNADMAPELLADATSSRRRRPLWQPSAVQLGEVLRSAALGGSTAILACVLSSPLPFSVADVDSGGTGLLAHSAVHAESAAAVRVLHQAGAHLTLRRLLYVVEKTVSPAAVSALLACQRPAVTPDVVTVKAAGAHSFTCPIHRVLHAWKRGNHAMAAVDPAAWHRNVVLTLETLLAAGYRPTVYTGFQRPVLVAHGGKLTAAPDPFDPFDFYPQDSLEDSRLVLVAKQGSWEVGSHRLWPDSFKAAVRTLLLAAHRLHSGHGYGGTSGSGGAGGSSRAARAARRAGRAMAGGASLGSLPPELLQNIVRQAAAPMSAWL